jgi:cytochrome c-type biogenesis protein
MVTEEVGLLASLIAGVFSFLSPCVLPLVPAYLSMITGLTIDELEREEDSQRTVILSSLLFVMGFSLVFVMLGASASAAGKFLVQHRRLINLFLGSLVVVMGLFVAGFIKIPRLYGERRFHVTRDLLSPMGPLAAMAMGSAFALGWTPCIGPILSSILAYAAASNSLARGVLLLSMYSLGLAIPFLLVGLFYSRAIAALQWFKRNQRTADLIAGGLLVVLGILLIFDSLDLLVIAT